MAVSCDRSYKVELQLTRILACYNMKPAIEFSAKHNIMPHMSTYKLEEVPKMIELMNAHKAQGRMGVVFD
jgi:propanol-preferring alcohol dehydrogenase